MTLKRITGIFSATLLALLLFWALTDLNYWLIAYILTFGVLAGMILVLVHLYRAVRRPPRVESRLTNVITAFVLAVIVFGLCPISMESHSRHLRNAFLTRWHHEYEAMAATIVSNRARLDSEYRDVGSWVDRSGVRARTNKEGILILFYGRVNGTWLDSGRVGYLYYEGTMVPARILTTSQERECGRATSA